MEIDELIKITRRVRALEALHKEGAMDRRDLEQALGVSKPTVHRFARFLGEQGLLVRIDGRFRLTPLGEVVAEEAIRFRDTVEGIQKLRRISQWLPVEAFDFDLRRFHDADIVFPDCSDPFAPVRKASTLLDTAHRVRVVSSVYLPETFATLCHSSIQNGPSVACVYDRRVLDVIRADKQARSNLERLLARGAVVTVHPEVSFSLFIADETVLVCAVDDRGVPKALVVARIRSSGNGPKRFSRPTDTNLNQLRSRRRACRGPPMTPVEPSEKATRIPLNNGNENTPIRSASIPKRDGESSVCVALIAHDRQKPTLVEFVRVHESFLCECACIATGTTGKRLNEATGLTVECMASGPVGGDILIAAEVASEHCDAVIFLRDPLTAHPHESDIAALGRLCDVHDVPIATNLSTAHAILDSLADGRERLVQRESKNRC